MSTLKRLIGLDAKGYAVSYTEGGDDLVFHDGYEEGGITYKTAPDIDTANVGRLYWDNGWKERPDNPATIDGTTLRNVPEGSEVEIEGVSKTTLNEGSTTLSFPKDGLYFVKVSCYPYLDKLFEIEYQTED